MSRTSLDVQQHFKLLGCCQF